MLHSTFHGPPKLYDHQQDSLQAVAATTTHMAPSPHSLKFVVTVIFIFCFPSNSVECYSSNSEMGLEDMQKVLGSRPPRCVNRCLNCKPCMATLVSPSQQHGDHKGSKFNFRPASLYKQDDTYYLLSWKCRCGDKLFEP